MALSHRFLPLHGRLRYWAGLHLGRALLGWSTYRAREALAGGAPIQVLVDNTVFAFAIAYQAQRVRTKKAIYIARVPVMGKPDPKVKKTESETRDYDDACYLTGIAHLARVGLIRLWSSGELDIEQWSQPVRRFRGDGLFDRSLFSGLRIEPVDKMPETYILPSWMNGPGLKEQQRNRLANSTDPLFRGILRHLGPKSSQDAWHIRTAEAHGLFCFLTTDHTLCRQVRERGKQEPLRSLTTRVMTPTELGRHLGLRPLAPRFLSYEDANTLVRADLSVPGNKRRRPKKPKV